MLKFTLALALFAQTPFNDPRSPAYIPPEVEAAQITARAIRDGNRGAAASSPPARQLSYDTEMLVMSQGANSRLAVERLAIYLTVANAVIALCAVLLNHWMRCRRSIK